LLLKSLTIAPAGKILERFQFTRIEIDVAIEDSELLAAEGSGDHAFHYVLEQSDGASASEGVATAEAGWLPPGFALSARNIDHHGEHPVQLSMYTDGFSTLTVVLERAQSNAVSVGDGKARRGATVAYMRPLAVDGRPYLLTVVGEVPLLTAQKVAQNAAVKRG
jgi:sigma-E factor negative regulatory protein RseB